MFYTHYNSPKEFKLLPKYQEALRQASQLLVKPGKLYQHTQAMQQWPSPSKARIAHESPLKGPCFGATSCLHRASKRRNQSKGQEAAEAHQNLIQGLEFP